MRNQTSRFKFGKHDRTLLYSDGDGRIVFTFDYGEDRKSLILEHHATNSRRPANYNEAFDRTREFLTSCGYGVIDAGIARLPEKLTYSEAAQVIDGLIMKAPPPPFTLARPPARGEFLDDMGGSVWELWLVGELTSGPHMGYKMVYDEISKQFGVANPKNVFHGFWGSFQQTLDALLEPSA